MKANGSGNGTRPRDFQVRQPAGFLKNPHISPEAKSLRSFIAAYADGHTQESYVGAKTLETLMRCARGLREKAQRELCRTGWLRVEQVRGSRGRFARRFYVLTEPAADQRGLFTVAQFHRSGRAPLTVERARTTQ